MIPLGIFSIPNTSAQSYWPARIAPPASMSAAPPLAHPASTSTMGTPVRPIAPSTLWPAATPAYAVPQNAAWNCGSPASRERFPDRGDPELRDGAVLEPAEGMDADPGDLDRARHEPSAGANV